MKFLGAPYMPYMVNFLAILVNKKIPFGLSKQKLTSHTMINDLHLYRGQRMYR